MDDVEALSAEIERGVGSAQGNREARLNAKRGESRRSVSTMPMNLERRTTYCCLCATLEREREDVDGLACIRGIRVAGY